MRFPSAVSDGNPQACRQVSTEDQESKRHGKPFGLSQRALAVIKGEKSLHAEVEGRGDVQDIGKPVTGGGGVGGAEPFGDLVDIRPIDGDHLEDACREVCLQVAQHGTRLRLAVAFGAIVVVKADLEAGGLPEFQQKQGGNGKRPVMFLHPGDHLGGEHLSAVA